MNEITKIHQALSLHSMLGALTIQMD